MIETAPTLPLDVIAHVKRERSEGATLTAIANGLTAEDIPTAQGGARWYPATIKKVLESDAWAHVK